MQIPKQKHQLISKNRKIEGKVVSLPEVARREGGEGFGGPPGGLCGGGGFAGGAPGRCGGCRWINKIVLDYNESFETIFFMS